MFDLSGVPHEGFDAEALKTRSIVVLSDTYPPFTHGGAEISLSICIDALSEAERNKVVVITHAPEQVALTSRFNNGVLVIRMPSSAGFPFEQMTQAAVDASALRRLIGERNHRRAQMMRRVLSRQERSKVLLARREARSAPIGGASHDHLISSKEFIVKACIALIRLMGRFDSLVADNTRSILLGAKIMDVLTPEHASIGIVRDNRFHCPRPSQSANVEGRACKTPCQFECAEVDASNAPELRRQTLRLVRDYRVRALNAYSKIVTTSHQLVRHLLPVLERDIELVRIPNGFGDLKEITGFTKGRAQGFENKLVIIGMLNENKGQLRFIKAATPWLKANPDIQLVLCGRGDRISKSIRDHAKEAKVSSQIKLLGFRSREVIYEEIRKAKMVLAPTVWPEPFGRVPLEAGAAGRAVVSFGVGGLNETIIDGRTGILVAPGDYEAFIDKVDWLLKNPGERLKMERAASSHILKHYGYDKTAKIFASEVFQAKADMV